MTRRQRIKNASMGAGLAALAAVLWWAAPELGSAGGVAMLVSMPIALCGVSLLYVALTPTSLHGRVRSPKEEKERDHYLKVVYAYEGALFEAVARPRWGVDEADMRLRELARE